MSILDHVLFPVPNPPGYAYDSLPIFFVETKESNFIPCIWLSQKDSQLVLMFCHGNGCDIGSMYETMKRYSDKLHINILLWEYPGYGCSPGVPCEETINIYAREIYRFITRIMLYPSTNVILYGQSIGTGVVCNLASLLLTNHVDIGGIILQSAYTCISDLIEHFAGSIISYAFDDRWRSIDIIHTITCPILFLHGKKDTIVPSNHSNILYEKCQSKYKHLIMSDKASHNEFNHINDIITPISIFINEYLPSQNKYQNKKPLTCVPSTLYEVPSIIKRRYENKHEWNIRKQSVKEEKEENKRIEEEGRMNIFQQIVANTISSFVYGDE